MYTVIFSALLISLLTIAGGMAVAYLFPQNHSQD